MKIDGIIVSKEENTSPKEYNNVKVHLLPNIFGYQPAAVTIHDFGYNVNSNFITAADGIHEVKTDFNFAGSAITVTNLVTSSVRGRDWSGFVKDILSKDCADVKVDIDGVTFTFKFTGQYSNSRPVYECTLGRVQLIYASNQWQFRRFDDGVVFGSVASASFCPEIFGWTWTDNTRTYSGYQGK